MVLEVEIINAGVTATHLAGLIVALGETMDPASGYCVFHLNRVFTTKEMNCRVSDVLSQVKA